MHIRVFSNKITVFTQFFRGKYAYLSNFYEAPVEYDGLVYQNSEAAFQAQKCIDRKDREMFTRLNPSEAKKAGRKVQLRKDWEERLEKEKNDAEKYANAKFAKDLLSVIDNFDRVTSNLASVEEKIKADAALKPFFDGVSLCGKELLSVFKKHGIAQIEVSEGATHFDPHYHQAMCEIECREHNPGTIINVMQCGYVYHDRLLRPAMVSVAKKAADEE